MARLSNLKETQEFIHSWRAEGESGIKRIAKTAEEQRANYSATMWSASHGQIPSWCNLEEYRRCVVLLEESGKPINVHM